MVRTDRATKADKMVFMANSPFMLWATRATALSSGDKKMGRGVKSVCAADHNERGKLSINNLASWHADLRIANSDQESCRSKRSLAGSQYDATTAATYAQKG